MRYKLTLFVSKYMKLDDDYQLVEVPKELLFNKWDDVQNVIAYMVDGSEGPVKVEIKEEREE